MSENCHRKGEPARIEQVPNRRRARIKIHERQPLRMEQTHKKRPPKPSRPRVVATPLVTPLISKKTPDIDHLLWIDTLNQEMGASAEGKGTTKWGGVYEDDQREEAAVVPPEPSVPFDLEIDPANLPDDPDEYMAWIHNMGSGKLAPPAAPVVPEPRPQLKPDMRDSLAWLQTIVDVPPLSPSLPTRPMEEPPLSEPHAIKPETKDEIEDEADWIEQFADGRARVIPHSEPERPVSPVSAAVPEPPSAPAESNPVWEQERRTAANVYLMGDHDKAAVLYRQLVKKYGASCAEKVAADLAMIVNVKTDLADYYYALAEAYTALEKKEKALEAYQRGANCL